MATTLDLLLQADENKIQERPVGTVKIQRLSKIAGQDVKFTCQALSVDKMNELQEMFGGEGNKDIAALQKATVVEGVVDPVLKDQRLIDKYKVPTPVELIDKILLPGEIVQLYTFISNLSGFGDDAVEEVKN